MIHQLSSLEKPISMIKEIQKNLSFFQGLLDNSKYHDKEQVKQMKKILQTRIALKLLIKIGQQKKHNIKDVSLQKTIKSFPLQMSTQLKDALIRIYERNDKENKYLTSIRFKLNEIYYFLLNKRFLNPNMNPNDTIFYSQMKNIVQELAKQTTKDNLLPMRFRRGNSTTTVNHEQEIETLKQKNKLMNIEINNFKNKLELMKIFMVKAEQQKQQFQQTKLDLHNQICTLEKGNEDNLVLLKIKNEKEKQLQLKLKQQQLKRKQAFEKLQKLQSAYCQQQSKHQYHQLQFKRQIQLFNQQICITKEQLKKQKLFKEQLILQLQSSQQLLQRNDKNQNTIKQKEFQLQQCKQKLTEQINRLNTKLQQLQNQQNCVDAQNLKLKEKNKQLANEIQMINIQNNEFKAINDQISKDNDRLLNRNTQLQAQIKKLANSLQQSHSELKKEKQLTEQKFIEQKNKLQKQFQQKLQSIVNQQEVDQQSLAADFSKIKDINTLKKQFISKAIANQNLFKNNNQLKEKIQELISCKSKLSKDLSQTKKFIDQIKKSHHQQIKKLTIQRNRAIQAIEKQKKAAEFKQKIFEKNNAANNNSLSQKERLQFGKMKADLQKQIETLKNNIVKQNKLINQLNNEKAQAESNYFSIKLDLEEKQEENDELKETQKKHKQEIKTLKHKLLTMEQNGRRNNSTMKTLFK